MTDQAVAILVLVVDDDDLILCLMEEGLQDGGYAVEKAKDPKQAMAMLDQRHAEFRALVTDVNLGLSSPTGWDVARHARELSPDIPVVYVTGDSGGEWTANGVPNSVLIMKPFAPIQIVTAVSQLLNAAGPAASP